MNLNQYNYSTTGSRIRNGIKNAWQRLNLRNYEQSFDQLEVCRPLSNYYLCANSSNIFVFSTNFAHFCTIL